MHKRSTLLRTNESQGDRMRSRIVYDQSLNVFFSVKDSFSHIRPSIACLQY